MLKAETEYPWPGGWMGSQFCFQILSLYYPGGHAGGIQTDFRNQVRLTLTLFQVTIWVMISVRQHEVASASNPVTLLTEDHS